jgi:hypothetical protein
MICSPRLNHQRWGEGFAFCCTTVGIPSAPPCSWNPRVASRCGTASSGVAEGNVWYLGEDSRELENGQVVSTEGSWEAGVNGAQAGIIMWADPAAHVGEEYRQEFARGEAEDLAKVVAVGESVTVPFGSFNGCIRTEDRNPLESGAVENKLYCPEVGMTLEYPVEAPDERTELVEVTGP